MSGVSFRLECHYEVISSWDSVCGCNHHCVQLDLRHILNLIKPGAVVYLHLCIYHLNSVTYVLLTFSLPI